MNIENDDKNRKKKNIRGNRKGKLREINTKRFLKSRRRLVT